MDDEDEEPTLSTDYVAAIPTTAARVLEEIINKNVVPRTTTAKLTDSPILRIQKQTSLFEQGSASMIQPHQTAKNYASDTEDNVSANRFERDKDSNRTKSCANLKISCSGSHHSAPHSPGAVLVQEKYIDMPMPKRVVRSFHGRTDTEPQPNSCTTSSGAAVAMPKPRFITTRVDENASKENV